MSVYVPRSATPPLDEVQLIQPAPGLDSLRRQTHWFIENDPTPIALIPVEKVEAPGGGWNMQELPPRPTQNFKLIYQTGSDGVVQTADGQNRRYEFILLGEWDAVINIGDVFTEPEHDGQRWVVSGLLPYNGYETKAGIVSYGRNPQHG